MFYEQIEKNKRKTKWLIALFCLLVLATGWAIGYVVNGDMYSGAIISAIILLIYVPLSYQTASKQVLAMSGAEEVTKKEYPRLYNVVEELIIAANLPMPKVYVVNDRSLNAFATGIKPEKACVAVTKGLLDKLNREELEGVIGHELAHIRNYDIRLTTISIALVSVIVLLTELGYRMFYFTGGRRGNNKRNPALLIIAIVLLILAPVASQMIKFAISRNREFLADATSVEFTRNPAGLMNALAKISGDPKKVKKAKKATSMMYISDPLKKKKQKKGFFRKLQSTHPPIDERIKRIAEM